MSCSGGGSRFSREAIDEIHDTVLRFDARPGEACYGVLQNKYLLERAEIRDFTSTFTINDDGTMSYTSDLLAEARRHRRGDAPHRQEQALAGQALSPERRFRLTALRLYR